MKPAAARCPPTIRTLGAAPVASAAPRPDEPPDVAEARREHRAEPESELDTRPIDGREHKPEAVETWRKMEQLARRDSLAGVISPRAVVGLDESGHRDGAVDWHYRPPAARPGRHHTDPLYDSRGVLMGYQQAPPVHVRGDAPGSAKDQRRRARTLSEDSAAQQQLDQACERAPRAEVAAALGLTPRQLRRRIEERNRGRK